MPRLWEVWHMPLSHTNTCYPHTPSRHCHTALLPVVQTCFSHFNKTLSALNLPQATLEVPKNIANNSFPSSRWKIHWFIPSFQTKALIYQTLDQECYKYGNESSSRKYRQVGQKSNTEEGKDIAEDKNKSTHFWD